MDLFNCQRFCILTWAKIGLIDLSWLRELSKTCIGGGLADWKEIGNGLVEIAGGDWLSPRLRARIESTDDLYVACSGGADSVFLLLYFATTFSGKAPQALHFNHKLRGGESDEDQRFVESICSSLEVPIFVDFWKREDVEAPVSEDNARAARLSFFLGCLTGRQDESAILTGHHAGDVVETLLMRVSRGSGLQGLTAPREVSNGPDGLRFLRPLLPLRKERIVDWLEQAGAEWREDASNRTDAYYRNRLRSKVIPSWEKASDRPVQEGAVLARALLEEDWEAVELAFKDAWRRMALDAGERLDWVATRAQPRAFQRRALNRLAEERSGSRLTLANMEAALEALRVGEGFKANISDSHWILGDEPAGIRVVGETGSFSWDEMRYPANCSLFLPDGACLRSEDVAVSPKLYDDIRSGVYPHDREVFLELGEKHSATLRVRQWKPGDAYQVKGRGSSVKLKELFSDRKIPIEKRSRLPVVMNDTGEILWVPGLPPNQWTTLSADTRQALRLTYQECQAP